MSVMNVDGKSHSGFEICLFALCNFARIPVPRVIVLSCYKRDLEVKMGLQRSDQEKLLLTAEGVAAST